MIKPEDLLDFVETPDFTESWAKLYLDDNDLAALQITVMRGGKNAPVIRGTGGLRKLRFSPPQWNVGKSGALRVCFVYYAEFGVILLVLVYAKSRQETISEAEKKGLRALVEEYRVELEIIKKER